MNGVTRRQFFVGSAVSFLSGAGAATVGRRIWDRFSGPPLPFRDVVEDVTPSSGFETSLNFGDAIQRLIEAGAVDAGKLTATYQSRGGVPKWVEQVLSGPSDEPFLVNFETAPFLLTLLWPIGLATKASYNENGPIDNESLPSLASTAGWTLGRESNGASYFNKVGTLNLTAEQERSVADVAKNTFRPCCDNSTLLQDCNHGSALLGLIELAVSQGASQADLYRLALAANSFWFPREYWKTAIYFMLYERRAWSDISPEEIMGQRFSTASGWQRNVNVPVKLMDFVPRSALLQMNQNGCGI